MTSTKYATTASQTYSNQQNLRILWVTLMSSGFLLIFTCLYFLFFALPRGTATTELVDPWQEPLQTMFEGDVEPIILEGWRSQWVLTPRATFRVDGRVIGNQPYFWRSSGSHMPRDIAIVWGELSDPSIDETIRISQGDRTLIIDYPANFRLTREYLIEHAANVHILPANDNIDAILKEVEVNDVVMLEGVLVDIVTDKFVTYTTSLSRSDTGPPTSCEILYVERVIVDGEVYE